MYLCTWSHTKCITKYIIYYFIGYWTQMPKRKNYVAQMQSSLQQTSVHSQCTFGHVLCSQMCARHNSGGRWRNVTRHLYIRAARLSACMRIFELKICDFSNTNKRPGEKNSSVRCTDTPWLNARNKVDATLAGKRFSKNIYGCRLGLCECVCCVYLCKCARSPAEAHA